MLKLIVISIVLLTLCMLGLALTILFRKNGKFPDTHISHNKEMQKLGITCVKHDECANSGKKSSAISGGCCCQE